MIEEILEIAFRGFWQFIGMTIIISLIGNFLIAVPFRVVTIIIKGWPPSHLNAAGNFKENIHD